MDALKEFETLKQAIPNSVPSEVYSELQTNVEGLSTEEAAIRLELFGKNTIKEKQGKPLYIKFLAHFTSMMGILLWVSGAIAFIARMP